MWIKYILLAVMSFSFGSLAAAGVFTVLTAVGLVPRFAGKTHTNRHVFLYENMIIAGTIVGTFFSIWPQYSMFGPFLQQTFRIPQHAFGIAGNILMAVYGIFSGMFIGCLALAIAEMLDSIPILTRRIGFRHGLGIAVLFMALGKICGSIAYFVLQIYHVAE